MYQPGRSQCQDQDAVTDMLYEHYAATIFTYVRQHTFSREDAEDILTDTFLAAMEDQKFALLSEKMQVAWLWRVARNKVIDAYRRSNIRRSIPLEQIRETIYQDEDLVLQRDITNTVPATGQEVACDERNRRHSCDVADRRSKPTPQANPARAGARRPARARVPGRC